MRTRVLLVVALLSPAATACYLPVNYKVTASPKLVGLYRRADGAPAAGSQIAVTSRMDDSSCAHANARATADSTGRFVLDATVVEGHGIWLIPAFEHFGHSYWVCAAPSDSLFRVAYQGFRWFDRDSATADTVVCQDYRWENRASAVCSSAKKPTLVTGGHWSQGMTSGVYRLILTEVGPLHGSDGDFMRPRLIVQWIEQAPGTPDSVRATFVLPTDKKFRNLHRLWHPRLWQRDDQWCLTIESSRMAFFDSNKQEQLSYALGAPGEARPDNTCLLDDPT
jgi:hypothetical protein